jgi:hypothetical protein
MGFHEGNQPFPRRRGSVTFHAGNKPGFLPWPSGPRVPVRMKKTPRDWGRKKCIDVDIQYKTPLEA